MRRFLIRTTLPLFFCVLPPLAAVLIVAALPAGARDFYVAHFTALDVLILGLGAFLFLMQMILSLRALRWRGTSFDERPDRWLTHLAQAAEWFPLLGLIGTVAGILQTFGNMRPGAEFDEIVRLYAPALTATGSGLVAALVNILPTWVVLIGRDCIRTLAGGPPAEPAAPPPDGRTARPNAEAGRPAEGRREEGRPMLEMPRRSVTRFFIPLIDVLTLLFCIFLMMPAAKRISDVDIAAAGAGGRLAQQKADLERLKSLVEAEKARLSNQLDELERQMTKRALTNLEPHVLDIDPNDGTLYDRNARGDRVPVNETEARKLVQRSPATTYFVIRYPPDPDSPWPSSRQAEAYRTWFSGASVAYEKNGQRINPEPKGGP